MPTLTLAASMLAAIWSTVPLAPAFCPVPRQLTFLSVLDQGNASQGRRAGFGIFVLAQIDPKNQFSLVARAVRCERDGDLQGAIASYSRLIKESGPNAWAQERLDWCQGLLEMGSKNLDRLLMAVRIAPGKFVRTYYSSVMDCDARTRRTLLHLLDARLQEHSSDDPALCLRALVRHVDGKLTDAIQDYKLYLWNQPRDVDLYLFLACAQKQAGDRFGSVLSARQFVESNANDSFGQAVLSVVLFETGNASEAAAVASRAIQLHPELGWPYYVRGVCRAKLGLYKLAKADFCRAMQDEDWREEATRMSCLVNVACHDLNAALADAEEFVEQNSSLVAIRLRACIHCLRCESAAAIADILRSQNLDRLERKGNAIATNREPIDPFGLRLHYDGDEMLSVQQDLLCTSYYIVAMILAGDRTTAGDYMLNLRQYPGWRPSLARGLYFATGKEYWSALKELQSALRNDSLSMEEMESMSTPSKSPDESKVASRDRLSYESIADLMSADAGVRNDRVPQKTPYSPLAPHNSFKSSPK